MARVAADAAQQHIQARKVKPIKLESAVSRHQWIVFVAEAKGCSQLVTNPVSISNEKAELPFLRRGFNELLATPHSVRQSQQELRPRVELIGSWRSARCGAAYCSGGTI